MNITYSKILGKREMYNFLYKYKLRPPLSPLWKTSPGLPQSSPSSQCEREREREGGRGRERKKEEERK